MSQPPGQYGAPSQYAPPGQYGAPSQYAPLGQYGATGQYGAPGQYGAGAGPGGFGPGGPGGFGPGGHGGPPQKKSALPWVITALVVVLAGVGVLLFFLLRGDDTPTPQATESSSSAETGSDEGSDEGSDTGSDTGSEEGSDEGSDTGSGSGTEGTGSGGMGMDMGGPVAVPGGAGTPGNGGGTTGGGMTEQTGGGTDAGEIPGSSDIALAWVQAVYQFDYATAYNISCAALQDAAVAGSQGTEFAADEYLGLYFYSDVLGGRTIADGVLVSVEHDAASGWDVASFELTLEDGTVAPVQIGVDQNLTVCYFA